MTRYSPEALVRMRAANFARWLKAAEECHGDRFEYERAEAGYVTQKKPPIHIVCREHGPFKVSPHDHLRFAGGGCRECGLAARGASKLASHGKVFEKFFVDNLQDRLELVTPYRGVKEPLTVRCRAHDTTMAVTPDRLMQGAFGCSTCARQSQVEATYLKLDDVVVELQSKLPDHVRIVDLVRTKKGTRVVIECDVHGRTTVPKGYITRTDHGCPSCGKEHSGYAGYRIQRLLESGERGRDTWLGVMEVDVFNITTLKVGVSSRPLEERYKWHLKCIFFSVKLRELDALLLENEVARAFHAHADLRVLKAGMRGGQRWSGDTECYWPKRRKAIIEFIKQRIEQLDGQQRDYWAEFEEFEKPDFTVRDASRPKSDQTKPKRVRCVETGEIYDSIAEAKRATGASNVGMAVRGHRRTAGGFRWELVVEDAANEDGSART